jgi:hypothetical protein
LAAIGVLVALLVSCRGESSEPGPGTSGSEPTTDASDPLAGTSTTTTLPERAEEGREAASPDGGSTFLTMGSGGFFGRVVSVDFGDEWAIHPSDVAVTPGAVAGTTVGPAIIHLDDGTSLELAAGTPGGNACIELARREDWGAITGLENPTLEQLRVNGVQYDCFIYGALHPDGQVAWFDIATEYRDGDPTATLLRRPTLMLDDMVVVDGGLGFRLAADVQVLCLDELTAEEYAADLIDLASRTVIEISTSSGEVTGLSCTIEF